MLPYSINVAVEKRVKSYGGKKTHLPGKFAIVKKKKHTAKQQLTLTRT